MWQKLKTEYRRYGRSLREPAFWLVSVYHFGRWSSSLPEPARRATSAVYGLLLTASDFILGSAIHREAEIGDGFHVLHGDGVRVGPRVVIGRRVGIAHGVTIGTSPDRAGMPTLGDDVFVGAGARILGPVRIGDRARVGANSVVVTDVPADSTAIGVPAKVLGYSGRKLPTRTG